MLTERDREVEEGGERELLCEYKYQMTTLEEDTVETLMEKVLFSSLLLAAPCLCSTFGNT